MKRLVKGILKVGLVLVGDMIDELVTGESREDLVKRIRTAADRGAELALENQRLHEEVDRLRFNGPTLWKDEVEAISAGIGALDQDHNASWSKGYRKSLRALLDRCDHAPMTSDELAEQVRSIANGTAELLDWDEVFNDVGRDVDDQEWGHHNPPPGYAKCTRPYPHEGPCAHPFVRDSNGRCTHGGWDFNYGSCPDCGQEGCPA